MTERVKDVFKIANKLDETEKLDLIYQLLSDGSIFDDLEDAEDALLIAFRKNEPKTRFEDFIAELRKEGRPV